jgi:hypothetical protein
VEMWTTNGPVAHISTAPTTTNVYRVLRSRERQIAPSPTLFSSLDKILLENLMPSSIRR